MFRGHNAFAELPNRPITARTLSQTQVGVLGVLGVLFIVSLLHRSGGGSGHGGSATRAHNPSEVPQSLRPISAYKDKGCKDIKKMPTLAGQRYIQIHNQVGGWQAMQAMIPEQLDPLLWVRGAPFTYRRYNNTNSARGRWCGRA